MNRSRTVYACLIILTILIGLGSRLSFIPDWIYPYLGDALYTVMYYFIFGFLFPRLHSKYIILLSIGICFLIEFSQFYQADWINQIRSYKLGGLILGYSFLWSDLVSYTVGGLLGFFVESALPQKWKN